jgi:hypothetical protein
MTYRTVFNTVCECQVNVYCIVYAIMCKPSERSELGFFGLYAFPQRDFAYALAAATANIRARVCVSSQLGGGDDFIKIMLISYDV